MVTWTKLLKVKMHHAHSVVKIGLNIDYLLGGGQICPPPLDTYRVKIRVYRRLECLRSFYQITYS